jgi:hypothetical protein
MFPLPTAPGASSLQREISTMDDLTLVYCTSGWTFCEPPRNPAANPGLSQDLSTASAEDLNEHVESASTDWLAFSRIAAIFSPEEQTPSRKPFPSPPDVKILLIFPGTEEDALACWRELPAPIAALRQNWTRGTEAVVFRSSFIKEHPFADVPDAVWDMMIETSKTPGSIEILRLSDDIPFRGDLPWDLPGLAPRAPDASRSWLKAHLESTKVEDLVPQASSPPEAIALRAGLWQIHDYLHESHELSQSIEGQGRNAAGDYWHAIMHRREPDYGNSKYWFRHVGNHPIFGPLRAAVNALLQHTESTAHQHARQKLLAKSQWDPMAFVDFCQECAQGNDPELTRIAEEVQWREMCLLLKQTYRDATE